jgi:hypothetical protein
MKTRFLITALFAVGLFATANAEDKLCSDLQVRVVKLPVYPPIALAAHFEGKIRMNLKISADAKVLSVENSEGPPLLQGAAKEYVSAWELSWQNDGKHHSCVEQVIVDYKFMEPSKSVSSYSYQIVTEDGTSSTLVTSRPPYYKPSILY